MGEGNSDIIDKVGREVWSSGATHSTHELGANQPCVHLDSTTDLASYHPQIRGQLAVQHQQSVKHDSRLKRLKSQKRTDFVVL